MKSTLWNARAVLIALAALTLAIACRGSESDAGPRFLLAGPSGLSEVSLSGTQIQLVTFPDNSFVLDPALSPNGRLLAFVRQPPATTRPDGSTDFGSDLYVADRNGRNVREVVRHGRVAEFIRSPAWVSNDEVLFTVRGRDADGYADFRIEKVNLRTGQRSRFIDAAVDATVSPDRRWIAYSKMDPVTQLDALVVADVTNRDPRSIVGFQQKLALIESVTFSPDGSRIAFAAVDFTSTASSQDDREPGRLYAFGTAHPFAQDVWVVNRDGSGLQRAADLAENMPSIAWSADGAFLYVLGATAFWLVELETGEARRIGGGIPLAQIVRLP